MKQLLRLLTGILPFFLFSCEYDLSGSHFEDVNPRPEVNGSITLHDQTDTVYVRGDVALYFRVDLPERKYYGYHIVLDNKVIYSQSTAADFFRESFQLSSASYKDGFYTLQIRAYANSKTGSLADKKKQEYLVVYRNWVVYIDNSPIRTSPVTRIAPEDGRLKVEWQPYNGYAFKAYEVRRRRSNSADEVVATITDPINTSWVDEIYVGGPVFYYVVTHTKTHSEAGPEGHYYHPLPRVLSYAYKASDELTFSFSSTPFHRNFKGYYVTSGEGHTFSSSERTDTVVTWQSPHFGSQNLKIRLVAYPNGYDAALFSKFYTSESIIEAPGTSWGPFHFSGFIRNTKTNRFYATHDGNIQLIDANTLQGGVQRYLPQYVEDYGHPKNAVSENAQYFYSLVGDDIYRLNPATLETLEIINLTDLFDYYNYGHVSIGVSNNNRLMIAVQSYGEAEDTVYVADMNRKKVLTRKKSNHYPNFPAISSDGKAVKVDNRLFIENSSGKWQQAVLPDIDVTDLVFHPSKPLFSVRLGQDVSFYSTTTGAIVRRFMTESALKIHQIDAGSGTLYGVDDQMMYIYDAETGQLRRKLKVAPWSSPFVFKDKIFTNTRYLEL